MNKRIMDEILSAGEYVDYNVAWLHWKPLHFPNVKTSSLPPP
jgi:hypothetical protein